ncbi:hypothetical protein Tco_0097787 [Tanacetum coccineum]
MVGAHRLEIVQKRTCEMRSRQEKKVGVRGNVRIKKAIRGEATIRSKKTIRSERTLESEKNRSEVKGHLRGKERMSAMLSSDATFSMELFPFVHCSEGNGDVSSVCSVCNNNNNNNKTNEDRDDDLDNVKTDDD